ncbi:MAG TPA: PIN domain-containing protein [Gemmatales bacterium]|nr:PIN domain-containing protein [Gemmatales bacterium]
MSWLLLDTNIISYIVKRHPLAMKYQAMIEGHDLAISFQSNAELEQGMKKANWGIAKQALLEKTLSRVSIIQSDLSICSWWAEVRLLRRSRPIAVADAWIAATALSYDFDLVTHNPKDFLNIPGL